MDIPITNLLFGYGFVLILLYLISLNKLNRELELILASFRMTIQLFIAGYVLVYIFEISKWYITILVILIILSFAIYNILRREKRIISKELKRVVVISLSIGTLFAIAYFMFVVIRPTPWYLPTYFIPLSGMLIGNAMTAVSLSLHKLLTEFQLNKEFIEAQLMLGATSKQATKNIRKNIFESAIIPTINSMMGMGIILLPGMMTGQIIAGASPLIAVKYQIAIMLGILGSVSMSVMIFITLSYKTFFNKYEQIKRTS